MNGRRSQLRALLVDARDRWHARAAAWGSSDPYETAVQALALLDAQDEDEGVTARRREWWGWRTGLRWHAFALTQYRLRAPRPSLCGIKVGLDVPWTHDGEPTVAEGACRRCLAAIAREE